MKKNGVLEKKMTRFKNLLKITKRKLNECANEQLSFPGDLKPSLIEMEIQTNMLKQKIQHFLKKI